MPARRPVILHTCDPFTDPRPFRPDVVLDIDAVLEQKLDAIMAHESQVHEWLPHINGFADLVPDNEPDRSEFLRRRERERIEGIAHRFAAELQRRHGHLPSAAEAYEISEYGAAADPEQVHRILSGRTPA